jgi:hypothetical protein
MSVEWKVKVTNEHNKGDPSQGSFTVSNLRASLEKDLLRATKKHKQPGTQPKARWQVGIPCGKNRWFRERNSLELGSFPIKLWEKYQAKVYLWRRLTGGPNRRNKLQTV